jgi:ubiquinone/menaquinone biosynthesis C-methylase UbiE
MAYTQAQLAQSGYHVEPAPLDDWRTYDEQNPVPAYFDFDWFSSRHPDLYHAFALSTIGLMQELHRLVDLTGLEVLDVGAGTGRSAMGAAAKAARVTAIDSFESVIYFGRQNVRRAGLENINYIQGHRSSLPFPAKSFDAVISSWAELDYAEAYRVLRPGGYLIFLGAPLSSLCGELTPLLASIFPNLIAEVAPADVYDPTCPPSDTRFAEAEWNGLPVIPPTTRRDFTYVSDYGDYRETAAIFGRLYGPVAKRYFLDRQQSTVAWRLRIEICRVRK